MRVLLSLERGARAIVRAAALVLVVAGCHRPVSAPPAASSAANATRADAHTTNLEVSIADNYAARQTCVGVPPRRYVITLDGRDVASVEVPCTTFIRAPSPTFGARAFAVPPGAHKIGVRDSAGAAAAVRELRFPVVEGSILAEKLLVDANGDGTIEIGKPQVFIIRI